MKRITQYVSQSPSIRLFFNLIISWFSSAFRVGAKGWQEFVVQIREESKLVYVKGSSPLCWSKVVLKLQLQIFKPACPHLTSEIFCLF